MDPKLRTDGLGGDGAAGSDGGDPAPEVLPLREGAKRRSGAIQVLQRADAFLDAVARSQTPLSGAALARQVGLNKSTTFNILSTLVELGYLTVSLETRHYRLGPRVLQLSSVFRSTSQWTTIAGPFLYSLRDETRETVSIHVRAGWERVCVAQASSLQSITRVIELGRRRPLYAGAAGAVLLASLDDAQLEIFLSKIDLRPLTPNSVTDIATLRRKIEHVRRQGFAAAYEEAEVGVSALSVPIRDQAGFIDAALVVSGPANRYNRQAVQQTLAATKAAAAELSREAGHAYAIPTE